MRIKVYQMVIDKGIFIILFSNLIDKFSIVHSNGSAIKNIPAFSDLKPTIVFVPSIVEQKKIGKCFKTLDHLITLHQSKFFGHILKVIASYTLYWEQRKLSEIYKNICNAYVGTATPYYVEDGHFYLEANNVKDGRINYNSQIFINDNF